MSDYQIKDMLAQFCVMLNCLNDMTKSMNEMRDSIKNVMLTLDEELNEIKPIKDKEAE